MERPLSKMNYGDAHSSIVPLYEDLDDYEQTDNSETFPINQQSQDEESEFMGNIPVT